MRLVTNAARLLKNELSETTVKELEAGAKPAVGDTKSKQGLLFDDGDDLGPIGRKTQTPRTRKRSTPDNQPDLFPEEVAPNTPTAGGSTSPKPPTLAEIKTRINELEDIIERLPQGHPEALNAVKELIELEKKVPRGEALSSRQRNSKRREYFGQNPNKSSTTYRDVVARMRQEGKIVGEGDNAMVKVSDGSWIPLKDAELAHTRDVMKWWNEEGKYWGTKHEKVREFRLDSNNYVLDKPGLNRSEGAKLKDIGYDPPDPRPGGPPKPPGS